MSGVGGGDGGSSRVSIPNNLRKTIQHIKEITACHSEEEIYAMLKECSMDPNETIQKLLFQDTFHEVKRRRNRKKENPPPPKETPEPRRHLGPQGRGSRAGRSNYLPRNFQSDAGDGRDSGTEKENGSISGPGTSAALGEMTNKETPAVASPAITNYQIMSGIVDPPNVSAASLVNSSEMVSTSTAPVSQERRDAVKIVLGVENPSGQPTPTSANSFSKETTSSSISFSSSDPVIVPSIDARSPSAVSIIKGQVGPNRFTSVPEPAVRKSGVPEVGCPLDHEKMPIKFPEGENSRSTQSDHQLTTSSQALSTGSRPQSNYSSRSLHQPGTQKVTQNKEWKPKPSNQNVSLRPETIPSAINLAVRTEERSSIPAVEETMLQKVESLNLPQRPPVILPRHIHILEPEKINFSFGSFDASFSAIKLSKSDPEDDDESTVVTEISHGLGGAIEKSVRCESLVVESLKIDEPRVNLQSQKHETEIVAPCEVDSSSSSGLEQRDIKQEDAFISGSHPYSMIHTSQNYNFGIVPQLIGAPIASLENSEPQERGTARLPSFVVPQPLDLASYYAQIYRSSLDGDGRLSPFSSHEIATKYNDYAAVLPQQSSQPTHEGGNPLVLSTSGPTPLVTQAAGLMQSSITMSQPPFAVFRPPPGVHLSPYHQNYIPYGHYFPPFYVPPQTIPQYMPNGAFPQQPHGAGLFPAPPSAAAQGIKYPLPQFKTSTAGSTTNAAHVGMPIGYSQYDTTPINYNSSSAGTTGNATSADDLSVSKFRESNMYVGGQQNDGSRFWMATPGRDMTSLATTSFYNIPNAGSANNVYQQQQQQQQHQHSQATWPNNY